MKDFKKSFGGNRGGFKGGFDRGSRDGGGFRGAPRRDERSSEMFEATCATCKKTCEVPFRPNGKKPVLCKDCFASSKGDAPERSFSRDTRDSRDSFRHEAPRHSARHESAPRQDDGMKAEIVKLGTKLDTLIGLMEKLATAPAKATSKAAAKPKKKAAK